MQPVDSTSRPIQKAGTFAVLFYVSNLEYNLCVMRESEQKKFLKTLIEKEFDGHLEGDWYRVDDDVVVQEIIKRAAKDDIKGVTFELWRVNVDDGN